MRGGERRKMVGEKTEGGRERGRERGRETREGEREKLTK